MKAMSRNVVLFESRLGLAMFVVLVQEFCTYFGRPNATYARTLAQANDSAKLNGNKMKMPMKQHVRIVGGHGRSVWG